MLVESLQRLQPVHLALYLRAHEAHWNVAGVGFYQAHKLFEEIYEDLHGALDPLSENIRKLGGVVYSYQTPKGLELEVPTMRDPEALMQFLIGGFGIYSPFLLQAMADAAAENEQGVLNFLAERQDANAKWLWFLRSSL